MHQPYLNLNHNPYVYFMLDRKLNFLFNLYVAIDIEVEVQVDIKALYGMYEAPTHQLR